MFYKLLLGALFGITLGEIAKVDTSPLVIVILGYFVGVIQTNVNKSMESKDAKKWI